MQPTSSSETDDTFCDVVMQMLRLSKCVSSGTASSPRNQHRPLVGANVSLRCQVLYWHAMPQQAPCSAVGKCTPCPASASADSGTCVREDGVVEVVACLQLAVELW